MSTEPTVSVVLPVFNAAEFLRETVQSVLAQTWTRWELIIVDDGSTDRSPELIAGLVKCGGGRIRCVRHPNGVNRGLSASRNLGVRSSGGEYVAFIDADDVWVPRKLSGQIEILSGYPQAAMVAGTPMYWYSWTGLSQHKNLDRLRPLGLDVDRLYPPPELLRLTYPLGSAVAATPSDLCMRRSAFDRSGGFEEQFTGPMALHEDTAFLAKIYSKEDVFMSSQCWLLYRRRAGSMSATTRTRAARLFYAQWLQQYVASMSEEDIRSASARFVRESRYPRITWAMKGIGRVVRPVRGNP